MSYSIDISEMIKEPESFENLTADAVSNPDYLLDAYAETGDSLVNASPENFGTEVEAASAIMETDVYYEILDRFHPIYNYAHVLQNEPTENDVDLILAHAPNVSILYLPSIEAHVIARNACGMDMSDSIAYAYAVIDRHIPTSFGTITERYTITEHALDAIKEVQSQRRKHNEV